MLVEKDDEYFFIGDNEWGVSVGYDIEDTAEILIPFSGSVKLTVVVSWGKASWPCIATLTLDLVVG
jgi:hypothetical protein